MSQPLLLQRPFFQSGATLPYQKRIDALNRLHHAIRQHEPQLLQALQSDLGKSATEAYMCEVGLALSDISYVRRHLKRWMKPHYRRTPLANFPAHSQIISNPYGVVLIMAPWNYPFLLTISPLVGALAAGNCCVLKPSELSPATSEVLTTLIAETFPPEYVSVVNGGIEESQALLELDFDYIFYTGGVQVGKIVMEKASKHLTPVTLELGGKSPAIVTADANLRLSARRIVFGKYLNAGQTCVAPDYVLCQKEVHQEFLQMLKEEIRNLYGEHPLDNPDYGKIINRRHFDRLCRLINPAKVVVGGESQPEALRIAPTVLDNVSADDPIMQEEIFGPLLPILVVNNTNEAFRFVQSRPHPLALYLFTQNPQVERKFMTELQFGGGCVNDTISHLAAHNLPFGGVGNSGMGAYHGKNSFLTFTHQKAIVKRGLWLDPALRYLPYTPTKNQLIKKFLQ